MEESKPTELDGEQTLTTVDAALLGVRTKLSDALTRLEFLRQQLLIANASANNVRLLVPRARPSKASDQLDL